MQLSQAKALLRYDPKVGRFYWKVTRQRVKAGEMAELEGYNDALEGNKCTGDRYDTTNPVGKARMKGFHKGQERLGKFMEERKAALKEKAKEAKARAKPAKAEDDATDETEAAH